MKLDNPREYSYRYLQTQSWNWSFMFTNQIITNFHGLSMEYPKESPMFSHFPRFSMDSPRDSWRFPPDIPTFPKVVTGSYDCTARAWDASRGVLLKTILNDCSVTAVGAAWRGMFCPFVRSLPCFWPKKDGHREINRNHRPVRPVRWDACDSMRCLGEVSAELTISVLLRCDALLGGQMA